MLPFKRNAGPPRRAFVGAGTLVALVVLQALTGMLGDLAVALLPDDWVRRRGVFIVIVLLISLSLIAALQWSTDVRHPRRAPPAAHRAGAQATIPPSDWTGPLGAQTSREPRERYDPTWRETARTIREGIAEVLAILGLGVRLLIWWVTRSADAGRSPGADKVGGTKATPPVARQPKPRPNWNQHGENVAVGLVTTFLLLFVMTNTGAPSAATETPLTVGSGLSKQLHADPLVRPSRSWPQDARDGIQRRGYARSFVDRTYRIAIVRANMKVTSVSADPALRSLADTKVQVSVRASGTVASGRFGALCRHKSDRYYLATVTDDGKYQIAKVTRAGTRVIGEGPVQSMRQANVSVLEFACTGGQSGTPVGLELVVNGVLTGSVEDTLHPLLTLGGTGLYAEAEAASADPFSRSSSQPDLTVTFEDFFVWTR